jgi:hypothetical protein
MSPLAPSSAEAEAPEVNFDKLPPFWLREFLQGEDAPSSPSAGLDTTTAD